MRRTYSLIDHRFREQLEFTAEHDELPTDRMGGHGAIVRAPQTLLCIYANMDPRSESSKEQIIRRLVSVSPSNSY